MTPPSDPTDIPTPLERLAGPPTQEGWYWFTGEPAGAVLSEPVGREMLYEVRWIEGQLMMKRLFQDDVPVAEAAGYWRGPLQEGPMS